MKTIATFELAEAAFYLKHGLKLEGFSVRKATYEPARSLVEMIFSGDQAGELGIQCITIGPDINASDLARLGFPLAEALAKLADGGQK